MIKMKGEIVICKLIIYEDDLVNCPKKQFVSVHKKDGLIDNFPLCLKHLEKSCVYAEKADFELNMGVKK